MPYAKEFLLKYTLHGWLSGYFGTRTCQLAYVPSHIYLILNPLSRLSRRCCRTQSAWWLRRQRCRYGVKYVGLKRHTRQQQPTYTRTKNACGIFGGFAYRTVK